MLASVAALALALLVVACGGGESNTQEATTAEAPAESESASGNAGTSEEASSEGASAEGEIPEAEIQKTIDKAMGTHVPISELPQPIVNGFEHATMELSEEQLNKALECWENSTCTVGDGEITLAIVDGNENTWRDFTKMETMLQALTYPEIGKIIYTNAQGDLSKMQSDIRNVTAQGAKAIVTYDDFGPAVAPAFAAAQRGGAVVSNYLGPVETTSESIKVQVIADNCVIGENMAEEAARVINEKGNVAYFNGTPGNPQGQTWNKCATETLEKKFPEVEHVASVDTEWSPAGAEKAASSLISSGKEVGAILYDYANPLPNVIETYEKAGKPIPQFVTWTEQNKLYGLWEKKLGTPEEFKLVTTSAASYVGRLSVTAVMESLAGEELEEKLIFPFPFHEAEKGAYQPNLPAEFPGVTILVPETLIEKMIG